MASSSYHKYEGIALDEDECPRLVADLGPTNKAMILVNHGLLVGGTNAADAFLEIYYLERSCQAQVAALSGGTKLVIPSEEVCRHTAAQYERPEPQRSAHLAMVWAAACRQIEHAPIDYRS